MKKIVKFFKFLLRHKIYTIIVILVVAGLGYFAWQKWFVKSASVSYVTATVERGALVSSISGTGQVAASNQLDIKANASGDIIYIGLAVGQEVKKNAVLVRLNASDALKTVRDGESSLEIAQLSMAKLQQPADELTVMQAENSLAQAQQSKQKTEDNLKKSYEDGFNTITSAFLDLPGLMTGLNSIIYGYDFEKYQSNLDWYGDWASHDITWENQNKISNYKSEINNSYALAKKSYDANFDDYKSTSRSSADATLENLILETYNTTRLIADIVKNTNNYLDFVQNLVQQNSSRTTIPATLTTHKSSLSSYTSKTNSQLASLLSIKQTIVDSKNDLIDADRTIAEKTISLADLKSGPDTLDIKSQELSIRQKENSLTDAREKLADYTIRAPFDGIIAKVDIKNGEALSSGTVIGTIITKQQVVSIALNEVDIAKVKIGQKAVLTFDAIDGLSITGEVAEIDTLGTASQGVVSYNVKIVFDLQDDRVKSGMSVSASIILESKSDVLLVSSSAVKIQGEANYVEVLVNGVVQRKTVTIGSSDDTMTEITDGLSEGEEIITSKTTSTSAAKTTTNGNSRPMGGGMMEIMR